MTTFRQVSEKLTKFARNSKEVSDGLSKLIPYIGFLVTGAVIGAAPLSVLGILGLAGVAAGISSILAVVADPGQTPEGLCIISPPRLASPVNSRFFSAFG
ncbi:MAG: hypothetical protein HQK56_10365 [Deltaproteobacteria bacterium]|nr:hypothetical protein [Deltaproteobacteria bacterium]